jgi:hypothetical protein
VVNIKKIKIFIIILLFIQFIPSGIVNENSTIEAASTKLIYKTDFEADIFDSAGSVKIDDPINLFDADNNTLRKFRE